MDYGGHFYVNALFGGERTVWIKFGDTKSKATPYSWRILS